MSFNNILTQAFNNLLLCDAFYTCISIHTKLVCPSLNKKSEKNKMNEVVFKCFRNIVVKLLFEVCRKAAIAC